MELSSWGGKWEAPLGARQAYQPSDPLIGAPHDGPYVRRLCIASSVVSWTLYVKAQHSIGERRVAEQKATDRLWQALLAEARARRLSDRPGRRFKSLEVLKQAAAIRPSLSLRNEALACMALIDV